MPFRLSICTLLLFCVSPLMAERPNVIVIMADDQGRNDFGAMQNQILQTPHIDALSTGSVEFTNFYVSPVCSPTRACLMTGRYNFRTRCIDTWLGRSMMEPEEVTIAEMLQQAGYATGIFGKWHLGDCYPMRPSEQGFDQSLVHRGGGLAQPSEPRENQRRYTDAILFENNQQVQTQGYCTDVYFDAAWKFIRQSQRDGKSFFVYLPTNAPHGPYHDVPEELRKQYMELDLQQLMINPPKNPQRMKTEKDRLARIAAMITNIDQNVGRLVKRLRQAELLNNTMLLVLNDNGPNTMRFVGELRGMKSHVHEGGIRSPLWVHWPDELKAGKRDTVAAHIDLLPTIIDACEVKPPNSHQLDGVSLLKVLRDDTASVPDRPIVIQAHRGNEPVRYHHFMIRYGRWKLLHASGFGKESFRGAPKFELYDLQADPGESNNLVDSQADVKRRLQQAYDRWFDDVSSTRENNYAPPRIVVGTKHENPTVLTRQDWRGGSWQPKAQGYWELEAPTAGKYNLQLLYEPLTESETAEITISPAAGDDGLDPIQHPIMPTSYETTIEDIALPAGKFRLQATLKGKATRGVYQLILTRKGRLR